MQKNYLVGGILLCIFPALVLFAVASQSNVRAIPPEFGIMLVVCFLWGIWTVVLSVWKLDPRGALSCLAGAIMVAGVAAMFFVVAWREKDGWSGPGFLPDAWNQVIPRILFAVGGVLATLGSISLLRQAVKGRK